MQVSDAGRWACKTRLMKYAEDIGAWLETGRSEEEFHREHVPYEVIEIDGNLLANAGIQLMQDRLTGGSQSAFSAANANIGIGNSSTAAAAGQTDLQGGSKARKGMDATYPSRAAQTLTFQSTFGSGEANFAWSEWGVFNAGAGGTMLNRKVESLGTKTTGSWTLQVAITIS